jgi:phage protein D
MEEGTRVNILYKGVDITADVQPVKLLITDNAGGKPDSLVVGFSDTLGLWSQWKPAKNDTLQVKHNGFDTGVMYIDELSQGAGVFELKALSIPQTCKTARTQGWEKVRFLEIVTQIAARYGFKVQTFGVTNHFYERVDQQEEPDFAFLSDRCELEGYALKVTGGSVVVYDEPTQEHQSAVAIIQQGDMHGAFEFIDKSIDIYGKCIVRSQSGSDFIIGEFTAPGVTGPTLKRTLYVSTKAEANRWAKGLLRSYNKYMVTGTFSIDLNTGLAAGSPIEVQGTGMFDGPFFIDRLVHDLIHNRTKLTVRKPLEGY